MLEEAEDKPPDMKENIQDLDSRACADTLRTLYEKIKNHRGWGAFGEGWPAQFMLDSEWNWRTGALGIEDW